MFDNAPNALPNAGMTQTTSEKESIPLGYKHHSPGETFPLTKGGGREGEGEYMKALAVTYPNFNSTRKIKKMEAIRK